MHVRVGDLIRRTGRHGTSKALCGDAFGRVATAFDLSPGTDRGTDRSREGRIWSWRAAGRAIKRCTWFQQSRDLGRDRRATLERQVGMPSDEQPGDAERPQDQQAIDRGRHEEAPCKRWSGWQKDSSKESEERLTCQVVSEATELSIMEYESTEPHYAAYPGVLFNSLLPVNWLLVYKHCHDMLHECCHISHEVAPAKVGCVRRSYCCSMPR